MIRDLLPPIIYKILHKIKSKFSSRVSPSEEKSYQSYEEALEDCTKNGYSFSAGKSPRDDHGVARLSPGFP